MKNYFLVSFLVATTLAAVSVRAADHKITSVTVYTDRALVTRTATVKLKAGEQSIVFEGLPAGIFEDSVAAGIRAGDARILGIELQRKFLGEPQDEKIKTLQREIEELTDQQRQLNNRAEIDRKQLEFTDKLQIYQIDKVSKDLATKETKIEEWDTVLKFLEKTRAERLKSLFDTDLALRELNRKLSVKQRELAQLTSFRPTETRAVTVHLDAKTAGDATLEIRYVIGGASWRPMYDARGDSDKGEIEMTYYGTVVQRTGEDWNDVEISLSTARPNVGAHLAELQPIYLTPGSVLAMLRPDDAQMRWRKSEPDKPAAPSGARQESAGDQRKLGMNYGMQQPAPPEEDRDRLGDRGWQTAESEARGTSAVFKVPKKQTIPSGERPQRVTVSVDKLKAEMIYVTRPKLQSYAFLKAMTRNSTENPMLAGMVNVFLRGDYIGQSLIETIAPKQEFPVYLGIDERVKVKREQLVDKMRDTFWGKKLVLALSFRITLENYTGTSQTFYIYDQMPVSKDASIEVRAFKSDLKPHEIKDEKGEIQWKVELKQGEKKIIEFGYEVVFPEDVVAQAGGKEALKRSLKSY